MKVLLTSEGFFPEHFGGGQVYVYRLAKELKRLGNDVTVLTRSVWKNSGTHYTVEKYPYAEVDVIDFSLNPKRVQAAERHTGFGSLTCYVIERIIKQIEPDRVYINGMKAAAAIVCESLKIPSLTTAHHVGIACPAGSLMKPDESICDIVANPRDCVQCCCSQKSPRWYSGGLLGRMPRWLYRPIGDILNKKKDLPFLGRALIYPRLVEHSLSVEKLIREKSMRIISPSVFIQHQLVRNGTEPSKIRLLPHGIEPIGRQPIVKIFDRPIRFGYVGRINYLKGLHLIIQAINRIPFSLKCELHIYGDAQHDWENEYLQNCIRQIDKNRHVVYHGLIPHRQLKSAYEQMDVLVVPSLVPEAFGLVVTEAFSAGRPVIASRAGALPENITDGRNGVLVSRNDSQHLAETMKKLIASPDRIIRMAENVSEVLSVEKYASAIQDLFPL